MNPFSKSAFSWEGEDILVHKVASDVLGLATGFYVDVGAHHPSAMSNTQYLYERGWRGLNIDAMPGSMAAFNEARPEDINIEIGVASETGSMRFSTFEDPALNGFLSDDIIAAHIRRGIPLLGHMDVECQPLSTILRRHGITSVDLLTVDAEGLDETVLRSNDFLVCRPKLVLVEILGTSDIASVQQSPIAACMAEQDYTLFSRLHFSALFMDRTLLRT